jgi:transposase
MLLDMKPPLLIRPLTDMERCHLEGGLRSKNAFTRRRCQILLASARHHPPARIAHHLGCSVQTGRKAIHAFAQGGLAGLTAQSCVPRTVPPVLEAAKRERVHTILHQSPRTLGKNRSTWTLSLLAEVCRDVGLSPQVLSAPTMRDAMVRLGANWKRAQHWITSPDPAYRRKKTGAIGSSV